MKLDILGSLITAISIRAISSLTLNLSVKLSSSSTSIFKYGTTPVTGTFIASSSIFKPGSSIDLSPLNLLIIVPLTMFFSSSFKNSIVPAREAKTPPLSISPTINTGACANFAIPIFTISSSLRFISAGLPAPSITIMSFSSANSLKAFIISGISFFFCAK